MNLSEEYHKCCCQYELTDDDKKEIYTRNIELKQKENEQIKRVLLTNISIIFVCVLASVLFCLLR